MKRKTRRIVGLLLAVLMVVSLLPMAVFAEEEPAGTLIRGFYFESDPVAEGWTFVDADGDGNNWRVGANGGSIGEAYEGTGFLVSKYNSNGSVNNWAVSPAVDLSGYTAGDTLELSLYARRASDSYVEHFQIWAGTSADIGEMTCISGAEDIEPPNAYTRCTADLSAYAGMETVYIAIRHCNAWDQHYLLVDAVEIRGLEVVTKYPLWIGDVQVTDANLSGEGWDFDPDASTLTLNGYTSNGTGHNEDIAELFMVVQGDEYGAIFSKLDELTITLKGTNIVTGADNAYFNSGLFSTGAVTINGGGSLTLSGGTTTKNYSSEPATAGIMAAALTIDVGEGNVSITGGANTKKGHSYGLITKDGFTVNSGLVSVIGGRSSDWSYGYYGGPVTINGGTVTVRGGVGYNSYGMATSALAVYRDELTVGVSNAQYQQRALGISKSSCTFGAGVTAIYSDNMDGSDPVPFEQGNVNTNKYFNAKYTEPPATPYDLWVAGTQVTSANAGDLSVIEGVDVASGGSASYDAETNTLKLNGAIITGPDSEDIISGTNAEGGIVYSGTEDFAIEVTGGLSTVYGGDTEKEWSAGLFIGDPDDAYNISSQLSCRVSVNVAEGASATFRGGRPTNEFYPCSYGICGNSLGQMTINGEGDINLMGGEAQYSYGISVVGGLAIDSEGTVNATGSDGAAASYGIAESSYYVVEDRGLTISGSGTVNAKGGKAIISSAGIYSCSKTGVLIDAAGGTVNATGLDAAQSSYDSGSYGIFSYNTIKVQDGTVKAVSGDAGAAGNVSAGMFTKESSEALVEISGGSVEAIGGTARAPEDVSTINSAGIHSAGAVKVSGSSTAVSAEGILAGIYAKGADITVSGGTVNANAKGDTTITDHGYNGLGIYADGTGKIVFSGEDTVVSAKGRKTSVFTMAGITIEPPLAIVLPEGGKLGFGNMKIVESDGMTNATDVLIKKSDPVPEYEIIRLAGNNRYDTAIAAAEHLREASPSGTFANVIIASGADFPDALSATYLASVKEAPILLVGKDSVSIDKVTSYINEHLAEGGTVYIVGGTGAVDSSVEGKLTGDAVRLQGTNRYKTNIEVLKAAGVEGKDVLIASGKGYADALSASAAGRPILLVADALTPDQKTYLEENKASFGEKAYIVGGIGAVSQTVEDQLKDYFGEVDRFSGSNRYDTSRLVAEEFFTGSVDTMVVASGKAFPDGLSGGPVAMEYGAPLILVADGAAGHARTIFTDKGMTRLVVMGGKGAVSKETAELIADPAKELE